MTELKCQWAMIMLAKKKIWTGSQNIISGAETCQGVQQRQFSLEKSFGGVSKSTTKTWRIRVSTPPQFLFLEFYLKRSISYLLAFQLHSWHLMALAFVIILPAMIYRWCESNNIENLFITMVFFFLFWLWWNSVCDGNWTPRLLFRQWRLGNSKNLFTYFLAPDLSQLNTNTEPTAIVIHVYLI